jgi:hypothetical protein
MHKPHRTSILRPIVVTQRKECGDYGTGLQLILPSGEVRESSFTQDPNRNPVPKLMGTGRGGEYRDLWEA